MPGSLSSKETGLGAAEDHKRTRSDAGVAQVDPEQPRRVRFPIMSSRDTSDILFTIYINMVFIM